MGVLGLVVGISLWGLFHSLLASEKAKQLARGWMGAPAERGYRLAYNLFAVFSLLPVAAAYVWLPDRLLYSLPFPWTALMWLLQLAALGMLAFGLLQTGLGTFVGLTQLEGETEGEARLVTTGLYRYVRHPLYVAGMALLWLSPSMSMNHLSVSVAATAYLLIGAGFEERKLLRAFGEAYREYVARTPMFIPFSRTRNSRPDPPQP